MIDLKKYLDLLGMRVEDRVTGICGIVTSMSFDLYGCIQAIVHPGKDKDNKMMESLWLDVNRLRVLETEPVMERPNFNWTPEALNAGKKGPSERPKMNKY